MDSAAEDAEFPHKRRNQLLAGLVAAVVMLTFALTNGIVKVRDTVCWVRLGAPQVGSYPGRCVYAPPSDAYCA